MTVQNKIFFTYLYLDNTTGMTHLKITEIIINLYEISRNKILNSYDDYTMFIKLYELNIIHLDNSYNFIIISA